MEDLETWAVGPPAHAHRRRGSWWEDCTPLEFGSRGTHDQATPGR